MKWPGLPDTKKYKFHLNWSEHSCATAPFLNFKISLGKNCTQWQDKVVTSESPLTSKSSSLINDIKQRRIYSAESRVNERLQNGPNDSFHLHHPFFPTYWPQNITLSELNRWPAFTHDTSWPQNRKFKRALLLLLFPMYFYKERVTKRLLTPNKRIWPNLIQK